MILHPLMENLYLVIIWGSQEYLAPTIGMLSTSVCLVLALQSLQKAYKIRTAPAHMRVLYRFKGGSVVSLAGKTGRALKTGVEDMIAAMLDKQAGSQQKQR